MKKRNLQLFFSIPILFFCLINVSDAADDKKGFLRVGSLELVPKLTISGTFNTNVFSEADLGDFGTIDRDGNAVGQGDGLTKDPDEAEDDDFIYSIAPGLDIIYPGENFAFEFGYLVDIRKYSDFGDEDHEHQHLKLKLDFLTPSQRYKFTVGGFFRDTRDPASSDFQSDQRLFNAERDQTNFHAIADLLIGRASTFIFKVARDTNEYDASQLEAENTESTTFGVTYLHKFWEKTSIVLSYEFEKLEYPDNRDFEFVFDADGDGDFTDPGDVGPPGVDNNNDGDFNDPGVDANNDGDFDDPGDTPPDIAPNLVPVNSDSSTHSFGVGLEWDPTAKITGRAMVGFESRSYDESNFLGDDESTFSLGTSLIWKAREKTSVNFSLRRSIEDSAFREAAFLTATSFGLGVKQEIGRKMVGELNGVYALNDYDDNAAGLGQRTDDKITLKASLKYNIKEWLYGKLAYQFQNNSSDFEDREYTINEITFALGTQF